MRRFLFPIVLGLVITGAGSRAGEPQGETKAKTLTRAAKLNREGETLLARGQARQALAKFQEVLALRQKVMPAGDPEIATALNNVGQAYHNLGQEDKARELHEQALAMWKKALPADDPLIAVGLNNLAQVYLALGRADKARDLSTEALELERKARPNNHAQIAVLCNNLAEAYHDLARPEKAQELHEQALALWRKTLPEDHPQIALSLNNLAAVYKELGQNDKAREMFAEALTLRRQALPAGHPLIGQSLNNLAATYLDLHRFDKARDLFAEALTVYRKNLPAGHPAIGQSLNNLALAYSFLGRNEKARELYEEALELQREALPKDHPGTARTLGNLAGTYHDLGQGERARELGAEALAMRRRILPASHPDIGLSLSSLAIFCRDLNRPEEAWRHARDACALEETYRLIVLAGSPASDHTPFLAQPWAPDLLLNLAADAPDLGPVRGRELLQVVAARQALSGLTLALRHEAASLDQAGPAGALYKRLKVTRQRLADLLVRGAPANKAAAYRDLCNKLQQEQDRLERELAGRVSGFVPLAEAARPDPDRLAAALGAGEAFVNLTTYRAKGMKANRLQFCYAALLLWRDAGLGTQVRFIPLGQAGPIDEAIRAWRAAVQRGGLAGEPEKVLRDKLWAPLAKALPKDVKRLAVCPEGQLALLPLGALRQEDGTYLLESLSIRYVGAVRDLLPAPAVKGNLGPAVVMSDPAYDAAGAGARKGTDSPRPPGSLPPFRRLPGFAREANATAALLRRQGGWKLDSLTGESATEEALAKAQRPRLLYLITHGFFLQDVQRVASQGLRDLDLVDPRPTDSRPPPAAEPRLRSGLALAGANQAKVRSAKGLSDGLLTALEVENLDLLGTELVILSACETGLGEVQVGEGVLGLRRAFQLAGAQTVIASLWRVPDAETEKLMTGFLGRWLKGAGKAEALRQAQLEMIRTLRKSANAALREAPPLYWAGFVCHGRAE